MISNKESIKMVDKILGDLKDIEMLCSEYLIKEKIKKVIQYIENETLYNKDFLCDMIYEKMKETKYNFPEMHTNFYLLYRKLMEDKISIDEAQNIYDMYVKEVSGF
jgi:hypothetical protein